MGDALIEIETDGGVRVVRLSRPPVNALGGELIAALEDAVRAVGRDPAVRAVVLYGGTRAFSAGADVREFSALAPDARRPWIERGQRLCGQVAALNRPVVAAIEGHCLGGGLELAVACHLRIAAEGANLGQPEIKLGLPPGFGGTQRLPRLVGAGTALEMLLTGEPIAPERALGIGLVNRVVPRGQALAAARELAATLASRSASATAAILALVGDGLAMSLADGLRHELDAIVAALDSPDGRHGTTAFLEKRAAHFDTPPTVV